MLRRLSCCLLALSGCATIASGPAGAHLDANGKPTAEAAKVAPLRISAREVADMSSPYFGELELTFENPGSQWVRIERVALDFGGEPANRVVSFPWGTQLESWAEATHQRNVVRAINDAVALELIGLGAAVLNAAGSRRGSGERLAGGLATMAVLSTLAAQNVSEAVAHPVFGGQHLFALPLEVPPGLFAKRFLVVNTPYDAQQPCLTHATLTYELADQARHRVALRFRDDRSEWQKHVCRRANFTGTRWAQ